MLSKLSTNQIIIGAVCIVAAIAVAGYIIYSLGGSQVDSEYKPYKPASWYVAGGEVAPKGSEKGNKYFDPSAESSSTEGKLSTSLKAKCEFNSTDLKVSCEAHRTSMQSTLEWSENLSGTETSGQKTGIFEFSIEDQNSSEVTITLDECVSTACKHAETVIDLSSR